MQQIISGINPINICGFVGTGKTAILEFFRGYPSICLWPGVEGPINRFPGGFHYLWTQFLANGMLSKIDLALTSALFLGELDVVPGDPAWKDFPSLTPHWLNQGFQKLNSDSGGRFKSAVIKFSNEIEKFSRSSSSELGQGSLSLLSFLHHWHAAFEIIVLDIYGRDITIWNNLFHPYNLYQRRLFNKMSVLVVERDARDQFADCMNDANYKDCANPAAKFVSDHQKMRASFAHFGGFVKAEMNSLWSAGFISRRLENGYLICVSFETFVTESSVREELSQFLGLDPRSWRADQSKFVSDVSAKNIGRFRKLPELQSVFVDLARTLPEYVRPEH